MASAEEAGRKRSFGRLQERLEFKVQDIDAFWQGLHEKENAGSNDN